MQNKHFFLECCDKRGNDDLNKISCEDCDVKNNLINEVVNGLAQLSSSAELTVTCSAQVHRLGFTNSEVT